MVVMGLKIVLRFGIGKGLQFFGMNIYYVIIFWEVILF